MKPRGSSDPRTFASAGGMQASARSGLLVHGMLMISRALLLLLLPLLPTAAWIAADAAAASAETSTMGTRTCNGWSALLARRGDTGMGKNKKKG